MTRIVLIMNLSELGGAWADLPQTHDADDPDSFVELTRDPFECEQIAAVTKPTTKRGIADVADTDPYGPDCSDAAIEFNLSTKDVKHLRLE